MRVRKRIRVIAIDDHPLIRDGIRLQLSQAADIALVAEGSCGDDVLRLPAYLSVDVMLIDLRMPQSADNPADRFRLLHTLPILRHRLPALAILVLSQYVSYQVLVDAIGNGVNGYLLKDDALTRKLPNAIRCVHRGETYLSSTISEQLTVSRLGLNQLPNRYVPALLSLLESPNLSFEEHAQLLNLSTGTFKNYVLALRRLLGVDNNLALIIEALRRGIVTLDDASWKV